MPTTSLEQMEWAPRLMCLSKNKANLLSQVASSKNTITGIELSITYAVIKASCRIITGKAKINRIGRKTAYNLQLYKLPDSDRIQYIYSSDTCNSICEKWSSILLCR